MTSNTITVATVATVTTITTVHVVAADIIDVIDVTPNSRSLKTSSIPKVTKLLSHLFGIASKYPDVTKWRVAPQLAGLGLLALATLANVACAPQTTNLRRHHSLFAQEAGQEAPSSDGQWRSPFEDAVPNDGVDDRALRQKVAAAAAASLGGSPVEVDGVRYRFDCSGVAAGIYAKAGLPLTSGDGAPSTKALYELVRRSGSLRRHDPLPGDLVFFDNTWDQNGNGRVDDPLSHVGVVETVDADGTVRFIHRIGRKIVRWRMNLAWPSQRADSKGNTLNHYLRAAGGGQPPKTTGELFVAFGSFSPRRLGEGPRLAQR